MLTHERLAEIKERLKNATPGRWFYDSYASVLSTHTDFDDLVCRVPCQHGDTAMGRHQADATFIAHSRQDVADLVSEVENLLNLLEEVETALSCYYTADKGPQEKDADERLQTAWRKCIDVLEPLGRI